MIHESLRALAVPIGELEYDPKNARKHGEKNIAAIRGSLRQYGQRKPIVVQRDGMIVRAGNGTLQAAVELGWTEIAAVIVDEDDGSAVGFAIADNRTAELASWDDDALEDLLRETAPTDEDMQQMLTDLAEARGLIEKLQDVAEPEIPDDNYQEQFGVIVICDDEAQQKDVFESLTGQGYQCKVVVT